MKTKKPRQPKRLQPVFDLENLLDTVSRKVENGQKISPGEWPFILKLLTDSEVSAGGPYYNKYNRIDLKFNLKIFEFLKTQKVFLPKLEKFLNQNLPVIKTSKNKPKKRLPLDELRVYQSIHRRITFDLKTWPKELKNISQQEYFILKNNDQNHEIVLLPFWFIKALKIDLNKKYFNLAINLGQANFYLWLAYKMYDDILDNETDASLLPLANLALRNFIIIFQKQRLGNSWNKFLYHLINELETQNYQEFCFSKKYFSQPNTDQKSWDFNKQISNLYKKSIAHVAGPLAILFTLNKEPKNQEFTTIFSFFKNYLNARQLNDDIYDWENDLKRKKINPVIMLLISELRNTNNKQIDFNLLGSNMINTVWPKLSSKLNKFIITANNDLKRSTLIKQRHYLERLIKPLLNNLALANQQRANLLEFRSAYQKL